MINDRLGIKLGGLWPGLAVSMHHDKTPMASFAGDEYLWLKNREMITSIIFRGL